MKREGDYEFHGDGDCEDYDKHILFSAPVTEYSLKAIIRFMKTEKSKRLISERTSSEKEVTVMATLYEMTKEVADLYSVLQKDEIDEQTDYYLDIFRYPEIILKTENGFVALKIEE